MSVKACSQLGSLINVDTVDAGCGNPVWSLTCSIPLSPPATTGLYEAGRTRCRNLCEIPQIGSPSKLSGGGACSVLRRLFLYYFICNIYIHTHTYIHTYIHTQGVPGGMCQTSGEYSLSYSIPK